MKILYDHQIFSLQKFGGISRYFAQIISNLPSSVKADVSLKHSSNDYIRSFDLFNEVKPLIDPLEKILTSGEFRGKYRLIKLLRSIFPDPISLNKQYSIELLKKQDFDVFHPTYYDDYFLEFIGEKPFVLDIHDMIQELYPEMLNDSETIRKKAILAHKANHIIAVSENTKKDLINILNVPENRISVIYRGKTFNENIECNIELPEKYLLFVGERKYYKNFLFFALTIEPILKENKDLFLICTGKDLDISEQHFLKQNGILSQIICKHVIDQELFYLYKNALAFVFPSYCEGFGLPILEAFEAECPIILSNSSCFPEIAGNAALYFEPKNKKQLVYAIEEIMYNQKCRQTLIENGKKRLELFSWTKSVQQTLEVYNKVLA